jgi:endonuclease/exonuclease/phosphatase (EEP) superfamily protein YafD
VAANVGANNRQHDQIIRFVQQVDPDFVLLLEANDTWSDAVQAIAAEYPYGVQEMKSGNFSTVLLSRHPIGPTTRKRFGKISMYALVTECDVNGRRLLLIASHLLPPYKRAYFRMRNEHLHDLIDEVVAYDGPVVLAGDLNLTPWSPYFQAALRRGGLKDSRRGFGLQPTWPSFLPGMRIPIDHVLVTPDLTVHSWSRGPYTGSDHLPIAVEFSLGPTPSTSTTSVAGKSP